MPPKRFLRLELVDGSLSVAAIQSEVAKRSQRNGWSAFAPKLSSFALRSFADAMQAEEIDGDDGAEVIQHASSQVAVRTSLVHAMTAEVNRDVEAALLAVRQEMRDRKSLGGQDSRNSSNASGGNNDEHFDRDEGSDDLLSKWRAACQRVERITLAAQQRSKSTSPGTDETVGASLSSTDTANLEDKIDLQLHRFSAWPEPSGRSVVVSHLFWRQFQHLEYLSIAARHVYLLIRANKSPPIHLSSKSI